MSQLTQCEISHLERCFIEFSKLPNKDRFLFFDTISSKICNDEWREKFRQFLKKEKTPEKKNLVNEFFIHTQFFETDSDKVIGCHACREAFWKLVFLSTLG